MPTDPVAIFDVDLDLLRALEAAFGPPIDSYLMGWQVWIVPVQDLDAEVGGDAAGEDVEDVELEFRLHPPAGFAQPAGLSHHDLWDEVMVQAAEDRHPFELGDETRELASLWTLLEVFPAFGEDVTPDQVRTWAEAALGRSATASGRVDHERLGGAWKRRGHELDLPQALREALGA